MAVFWWNKTNPNANANSDPSVNLAPQMAPSAVSPSGRAILTAVAQYRDDIAGSIVTSGTSAAYTVTTNSNFNQTNAGFPSLSGQVIAFSPHITNTAGPVTLNVDSLGAKPLRSAPNVELLAGTLIQGTPYLCTFNNSDGAFYLQSFYGNPYNIPLGASIEYWAGVAPNSSFAFAYGQGLSTTVYATLFALFGYAYGGSGSIFNLPDKRGRFSLCADTMGGTAAGRMPGWTLGVTGGQNAYNIGLANLPNYAPGFAGSAGTVTVSSVGIGVQQANPGLGGTVSFVVQGNGSPGSASGTFTPSGTVGSINGGQAQQALSIVPPAITSYTIIRVA